MSWEPELKRETHQELRNQHNGFLEFWEHINRSLSVSAELERINSGKYGTPPPFVSKVDRWGSIPMTSAGVSLGMDKSHDMFGTRLFSRDAAFAQKHPASGSLRPTMATSGIMPDNRSR